MSNSFGNFADKNPFEDPAVLEALKIEQSLNAGPTSAAVSAFNQTANQAVEQAINQAIIGPPPPYASPTSYDPHAAEELRKKQDELERKAAELQRREEEMQRNVQQQVRRNNFPPLPSFCPLKPCFYQDISIDIPLQFQNIVKIGFKLWLAYVVLLLINMFISMIYLISSISNGISNSSGSTFGLSIVLLFVFSPCSFVCWFRPLYNAFRIDSSFNFFFFFFVFFVQFIVSIIQALGVSGWGTVDHKQHWDDESWQWGSLFAGLLMLLVGLLFVALAVLDFLLLLKVHRIFRSTGATFAKAQQEFAQDIMGNRTLQQAASNLISSNSGAADGSNRY